MLKFELELAEQDLWDHDGSEIDAPERIKTLLEKIKIMEEGECTNLSATSIMKSHGGGIIENIPTSN